MLRVTRPTQSLGMIRAMRMTRIMEMLIRIMIMMMMRRMMRMMVMMMMTMMLMLMMTMMAVANNGNHDLGFTLPARDAEVAAEQNLSRGSTSDPRWKMASTIISNRAQYHPHPNTPHPA